MQTRNFILYELNEVPWRVIDAYGARFPHSTIALLMAQSAQYTTVTKDSGELHPWSTWPTFHRGVYNDQHEIFFINQKIKAAYLPIWEILARHDIRVGVFGSLQSWPVPKKTDYAFYVPDTFAPKAQTFPEELEVFQEFNLKQTRQDGGGEVSAIAMGPQLIKDIMALWRLGLSTKTLMRLGWHVLKERFNALHKSYRSILQAPVAFDFFFKLLSETKPQFATFFTNHCAGMMHRYWKQTFPNDFTSYIPKGEDVFLGENVMRAMHIANEQLTQLREFAQVHDYTLLIASSMGQSAVDRGPYKGELRIVDLDKFYEGIGYTGCVHNNLAMQPDFSFSFDQEIDLEAFKSKTLHLRDGANNPLFTYKRSANTLNLNLLNPPSCLEEEMYYLGETGDKRPLKEVGIERIFRQAGTAYHVPEGILMISGPGIIPMRSRERIESISVTPAILTSFGVKLPKYMVTSSPLTHVFARRSS